MLQGDCNCWQVGRHELRSSSVELAEEGLMFEGGLGKEAGRI